MPKPLLLIPALAFSFASAFAQTPVVNAKRSTSTITINGNPNESLWEFTNNVTKTLVGSPNNTVKYAVLWDNLNLYVAVTVIDANKYNESTNAWDDDAVELFIDADNNGGTTYGTNDRQFFKEWNSSSLSEKNSKTTNVQHAWANITNGYAVEFRIPWSSIGISNPQSGFTIGFDVAVDDDDNGGTRESQLVWAGDNDNWRYPRNFGDLILVSGDSQAPTAPTGLAASAITQSSLTLGWTASTDNVAVTGYDVYRNGVKINSTAVTSTSYNVTGLAAATAYQFYVRAIDAAGNVSGNSNTINVTTPDTQVPTAPSNLAASAITPATLTLSWTASSDNVAVTGYDVYQNGTKINTTIVTATTYNVTGLAAATAYSFYIQASDAAGNTAASSSLPVTTLPPPDTESPTAPENLVASAITQSALTLGWTASSDNVGVTGYDVYRNGVKINASPVTTTYYNVTGLAASTAYQFYVLAKDAAGNFSGNSNTIDVTTPDTQAPTAPSNLAASAVTQATLTLSWTASSDNVGVTGYDVYQDGMKINATAVTATTYNVAGLAAATSYSFYIQASDAAGNTVVSSSLSVTTLAPPDTESPTAPENLAASAITQSSLTLGWTASTDNITVSGYDIYRNGVKINASLVTTTSYNVTGLAASTAYQFYVLATDAAGNVSANSNTIDITTPDTQAPTAPSGLASSGVTATSLLLNWTASTDNVDVAGYDVYQNGSKINATILSTTNYSVTGLVQGTSYSFYIKALDAAGNQSANSNTINVTTSDIQSPSAPSNLAASAIVQTSLTLNWTAATDNVGVTGYDVYRNGIKINSSIVTVTNYSATGLTAATAYTFYVQARDAAGNVSANSNTINVTTPAAIGCTGTGSIRFQKWTGISGTGVSSLTSNANYPNNPASSGTLTSFEIPTNGGDNYGMKVFGYICPPSTGSYTFWIASDDNAELWLSTNSSPASRQRIAYHTTYTSSRQWNKVATQKSAAITLTFGQVYYIEALMKEGTQGDNMAVGWAKPGQSTSAPSEVIPGSSLMALLADTEPPSAAANLSASNITQSSLTLTWTASTDNVAVAGYDVYRNGTKINTAVVSATTYSVTGLTAATSYSFYVQARDAAGNISANSNTINITTGAPDTEAPSVPDSLITSIWEKTSFTLIWKAATDNVGVTGYDVYRNGVKVNASAVTDTRYSVTGLSAGTTYAMTVVARDAAGNTSAASETLNATTLIPNPTLENFTQRTIIANQRMPHDLVYGPDENIWYTERFGGTVSFINPVTTVKRVVLTLGSKMVRTGGQDGLMGLALHPQFRQGKPYVYISYTYQSTSTTMRRTRVERYTYDSIARILIEPVTILENIPGSNDHNSGRIAIGPDMKVYYTIGDMGGGQYDNINRNVNSQDLNIYEGKILRLNTEPAGDGSWIPADNPFSNGGQKTAVYSFGHRNPQGLVWGNVNGTDILYSSEHGPFSDDEINIIEEGRNYGWPLVAGFCDNNYNGRFLGRLLVVNERNNCAMIDAKEPIRSIFPATTPGDSTRGTFTWPSTAPSGTDFYGSNSIPGWQNSLLVTQLKKGAITRFKLSNDGRMIISDTIHYFQGLGRFRDVVVSADGLKIYVACDSSGATSGPTQNVTNSPANPGYILEFTYQPASGARTMGEPIVNNRAAELLNDKTIEVYPNPASNYFVIYNYAGGKRNMELYDMTGRLVKKQVITNMSTRVNTDNLTSGVYVLKVTDSAGKPIRTEKMIIQQ